MTDRQLPEQARASITTNEAWHPEMGWSPDAIVTDETFDFVISDMGREGVTWLRVHVDGRELWLNLANVVSIGQANRAVA